MNKLHIIPMLSVAGLVICVVTGKTGIADYLLVFVLEVSIGVAIQFFSDWLTDKRKKDPFTPARMTDLDIDLSFSFTLKLYPKNKDYSNEQ